MKTYTFKDDGYWDNPPCDCCTGGYYEYYNSNDTLPSFGSALSEEDCYVQAIVTEKERAGVMISTTYEEALYEMDMNTLKQVAKEIGIEVVIE